MEGKFLVDFGDLDFRRFVSFRYSVLGRWFYVYYFFYFIRVSVFFCYLIVSYIISFNVFVSYISKSRKK